MSRYILNSQEQQEELEVLQSIYPDRFSFKVLNDSPAPIKIRISDVSPEDTVGGVYINLDVHFTPGYPLDEVPDIFLSLSRGRIIQSSLLDDLSNHLKSIAKDSIGMAVVFTLVTTAEDWLREHCLISLKSPKSDLNGIGGNKSTQSEQQEMIATMDGGPVTRESFLSWWTTFSREELGALLQKEDEAFDILCGRIKTGEEGNFGFSKLSGKQLFEQQKVNTTSDISFLGDTPNDEAVFDAGLSLEPLELEAQEEDMFDKE